MKPRFPSDCEQESVGGGSTATTDRVLRKTENRLCFLVFAMRWKWRGVDDSVDITAIFALDQ